MNEGCGRHDFISPRAMSFPSQGAPHPFQYRRLLQLWNARVFPNKYNLAVNCRNVCGVLAGKVLYSALFHKVPQKGWCMIEKSHRLREQARNLKWPMSSRLPGSAIATWSGAKACQTTQQDQENFYFFLFLLLSLTVKQLNEINRNQLTPSEHFSGLNSILYWAVELLWFTSWRSALTGEALFGGCFFFFVGFWGFFPLHFF